MVTLQEEIRSLEERLLSPAVRASAEELSKLLADNFLEFGKSGRSFDKQTVIESLTRGGMATLLDQANCQVNTVTLQTVSYTFEDFVLRELCNGVVLVTYRISGSSTSGAALPTSLRSSIWVFRDNRWQMFFHQGTPTPQACQNSSVNYRRD